MLDVLAQAPDRSAALLRFVGNLDADDAALLARALGAGAGGAAPASASSPDRAP